MEMNKYLGLLKWSLKYSDGTSPTSFTPMQEERRQWLKEAIEFGTVDPADQMKAIISTLKIRRESSITNEDHQPSESEANSIEEEFVQSKVEALEALQDWVESIDWAQDLHKLGGFETVIQLCGDKDERIRVRSMEVFATVVQNNPKCQELAMELNALNFLMENLTRSDRSISENEQAKNLLSVSCLVRDCTAASVAFIKEHKGVTVLMSFIRKDGDRKVHLKGEIKALFLMRYIFISVPIVCVVLAESIISALKDNVISTNMDIREHSLHLLESIYSDSAAIKTISEDSTNAILRILEKLADDSSQDLVSRVCDLVRKSTECRGTVGTESVEQVNLSLTDSKVKN